MTCMDALMPRAQDAQERPLAGRSASLKPNFARNTAIPKLMTVSLGGLQAIPGADAEFFFGPSSAIPGGSFAQHEASLQNCWAHPTLTAFRQGRPLSGIQIKKARPLRGEPFLFGCLTMTYSHMEKPHTTIGAEWFHF